MGETAEILAMWRHAVAQGDRVCLATVVHVEGSSYRKPGARMLVTSSGLRAGTISGGCLEAEVSRKAWWLTAQGSAVASYQSSFDEDGDGVPWGLGCGGTVWVLLEQNPEAVLTALASAAERGNGSVIVTRLAGTAGTLAIAPEQGRGSDEQLHTLPATLQEAVRTVLEERQSMSLDAACAPTSELPAYFVEYLAPPPRLTIFGAGDDAQPIARFAEALGWRVAVADGRSHLLRRDRFPGAAELRLLVYASTEHGSPVLCGLNEPGTLLATSEAAEILPATVTQRLAAANGVLPGVEPGELAVVLTHSFEQDRALLAALLPAPLGYLGILGPRHRTLRLLEEVAPGLGWSVEACFERLHSPVGLDLGARDPAAIALAIVAELQAVLAGRQVSVQRQGTAREQPAPVHG